MLRVLKQAFFPNHNNRIATLLVTDYSVDIDSEVVKFISYLIPSNCYCVYFVTGFFFVFFLFSISKTQLLTKNKIKR